MSYRHGDVFGVIRPFFIVMKIKTTGLYWSVLYVYMYVCVCVCVSDPLCFRKVVQTNGSCSIPATTSNAEFHHINAVFNATLLLPELFIIDAHTLNDRRLPL
ncbi:hypothetical protein GOODEAATRI_015130 [Goodea atripinnis]|uniref:Secreted protein n=1 Tax=Goodea atripinnis TaxID=208336 RepID=A0ABV0PNU7_9TELE